MPDDGTGAETGEVEYFTPGRQQALLKVAHGIPVIFDATANRRHYRDFARELIPHFFEVAIVTPLGVCEERDCKGTYRKGREGKTATVPGLQEPYEAPLKPEVVVDTTLLKAHSATEQIMESLREHGPCEIGTSDNECQMNA